MEDFIMYFLPLIAFILAFLGFSAPGVGIWLLSSTEIKYAFRITYLNRDPLSTAAMLMTLASIFLIATVVTSGLEKCGVATRKIVLRLHIGFASALVLISLGMIISSGIFLDSIYPEIEAQMREDVKTKYVSEVSSDFVSMSWNQMQTDWKCCGSSNYTDYRFSKYAAIFQQSVPWTCCVMYVEGSDSIVNVVNETACRIEAQSPHLTEALYLHTKGCYKRIDSVLGEAADAALAMSCLLFVMEVCALIISGVLLRNEA